MWRQSKLYLKSKNYERGEIMGSLNKKTIKKMKQEVSEETALGIGFYPEILNKISGDIVFEAFKEISLNGWINSDTSNSTIENMVITESIKKMGYQEFKEVMPYLFSYPHKLKELDSKILVKQVEISENQYLEIQSNGRNDLGTITENLIDDKYGYIVHDLQEQSSGFMDYATGYSLEAIIEIRWSDYLTNQDEELEELDSDVIPEWFDKEFVEDTWEIKIVPLTRDDLISLGIEGYNLSIEQRQLLETANAQIDFLKDLDLWYVGSVDYYSFGYMPDDLIDGLLSDGAYGDESNRQEYESYFGWYKEGGEVSNTLVAMAGVSLVNDLILGDVNLADEFKEEIDAEEFDKLIRSLEKFETKENRQFFKNVIAIDKSNNKVLILSNSISDESKYLSDSRLITDYKKEMSFGVQTILFLDKLHIPELSQFLRKEIKIDAEVFTSDLLSDTFKIDLVYDRALEFVRTHLLKINHILKDSSLELLLFDVKEQATNNKLTLSYLMDSDRQNKAEVLEYLNNQVSGSFQGTLAEVKVTDFINIDTDNEKISKFEAIYPVNLSLLNENNPLVSIKKIYRQFDRYTAYLDNTNNLNKLDNKHTQSKSL